MVEDKRTRNTELRLRRAMITCLSSSRKTILVKTENDTMGMRTKD